MLRGQVFTLTEIIAYDLPDAPALMLLIDDEYYPVQHSHLTFEELLGVPGLADSKWTYIRTTSEWVPVFHQHIVDVEKCFDIEKATCQYIGMWILPKNYPRAQNE